MKTLIVTCLLSLSVPCVALPATVMTRHVLGSGAVGVAGGSHVIRSTAGQDVVGAWTAVTHGVHAGFWLRQPGGTTAIAGPVDTAPRQFRLYRNHPNPFAVQTVLSYDVPASGGRVRIAIYGVDGRLVRTLVDATESAGRKTVVWDGRNRSGRSVPAGIYFYTLDAPDYRRTFKTMVVR